MTWGAADLKPLVIACLDDNPMKRPSLTQISMTIKRVKDECNQKNNHDGISPIVWWAEVTTGQVSYYYDDIIMLHHSMNNPEQAMPTHVKLPIILFRNVH